MTGPFAVFVDRDGVLDELVPDRASGLGESPLRPEVVRLVRGAGEALAALRAVGYRLVCVTNQPAAAKGAVSLEQLVAVQARVEKLLGEIGVRFDAVRMCLHHPQGTHPELATPCSCRKPRPGMITSAASQLRVDLSGSWMIGDTDDDILAGQAAGCRTILVETPASAHKRRGSASPDAWAPSLQRAVGTIVGGGGKD